jgi:spermidine synthase
MALDKNWFTEIDVSASSAFSLKITAKLHEEQSPFQKVEVYETEKFGNLMTIDGFVMLTSRDNFVYHEMMAHPVLFAHPNPKNVVIIGGGDCGTLREVLKHPNVQQVTQVDIDEAVTRASEKYFPELCESNHDPRATLLFDDGIKWMQDAADDSIDIVIVDSTDPVGPGKGLFNVAFYQQCRRVLGQQGLLIQQSESPLIHLPLLQSIHHAQREAGFATTRSLQFHVMSYPSGWWTGTIAGQGDLTQFRREDAQNRPFETLYYTAEIHQASFALPHFLQQALPA